MRKALRPRIIGGVGLLLLLSSCATYNAYYAGLFEGRRYLDKGQYDKALEQLQAARIAHPDGQVLSFLATARYRTADFAGAVTDAGASLAVEPNGVYALRALGYRALALFRLQKSEAGEALGTYLRRYRLSDPLTSIDEVEIMATQKKIDPARLETLIDEQVRWYEGDVEQYLSTGTGFYDRYWNGGLYP